MLKKRIARGETVVGSFVFLASPEMVEILALAGMDYIIVDMEHSPKDWNTIQHMIRAANLHKLPVLIRVSENSEKLILQCLEIGADGLVVPFVQNGAHVASATRAMLYPPEGTRGTCTLTRMTGYGAHRGRFLEHCRAQNERLVLFAQVEDRAGVDDIDGILSAEPGVDAVLIGRSDLASSYGTPGDVESADVLAATDRILDAARARGGRATAMGIYTAAEIARWKSKGCNVFFAPSDGILAFNAARQWLQDVRGKE
ncbi:HpcH/HpaI aldolase family protein [Mesorhizobium sp. A623]